MNDLQHVAYQIIEISISGWGTWHIDTLHPATAPSLILIIGAVVYAFKIKKRAKIRRRQLPKKMFPNRGRQ